MSGHRGDGGETGLGSGQRVRKDDPRIACVGSIDELSSFLGLAIAAFPAGTETSELIASLRRIQRELHLLGAELARREAALVSVIGAEHVARAVCRRAEREVVHLAATEPVGPFVIPYLNRLSLVLFALARRAAHLLGAGDDLV